MRTTKLPLLGVAGFALLYGALVLTVVVADTDRWHPNALVGLEASLLAGVVTALGTLIGASLPKQSHGRNVAFSLSIVVMVAALLVVCAVPHGGRRDPEARAISTLGSFVQAQHTYASVNGGSFEPRLECLSEPHLCLADYPESAPNFANPLDLWSDRNEKDGYLFLYFPTAGVDAGSAGEGAEISVTSVEAFAVVATPSAPWSGGKRSFCSDSSGTACYTDHGRLPVVRDGRCEACTPLDPFW